MFATVPWLEDHPFHHLHYRSTDCSDHAPLLLVLSTEPWARPRFRFECFWPKVDGFLDVVAAAWNCPWLGVDGCRSLDHKLRAVARALRSWAARRVGSVRLQLAASRVVVFKLDVVQESRMLSEDECELRRELKVATVGLSSLARTIAKQKSRCRFLKEGDANTRFFNLQACHRKRKSYIPTISHGGHTFTSEEAKSGAVFDFYDGLLGTRFHRLHRIDLARLDLSTIDLQELAAPFTKEEITRAVLESPPDRAPGPDSLVVKSDVCAVFQSLWSQDWRSFYLLNNACMVLLRKREVPVDLRAYRPNSLIHSFGKLVIKTLALRLAPAMDALVRPNQMAFIRGCCIHDTARCSSTADGCTRADTRASCSRLILPRRLIRWHDPSYLRCLNGWGSRGGGATSLPPSSLL